MSKGEWWIVVKFTVLGTLAAWLLAGGLVVIADGQERKVEGRRLESVTWDPVRHTLRWTMSRGELRDGKYELHALAGDYEIQLDKAEMKHRGAVRQFSPEEARYVHGIVDWISGYAAESVFWFEEKQGAAGARAFAAAPEERRIGGDAGRN